MLDMFLNNRIRYRVAEVNDGLEKSVLVVPLSQDGFGETVMEGVSESEGE